MVRLGNNDMSLPRGKVFRKKVLLQKWETEIRLSSPLSGQSAIVRFDLQDIHGLFFAADTLGRLV